MSSLGFVEQGPDALRRQFPHVDDETISLFVESCGVKLEEETISSLAEMQEEARKEKTFGQPGYFPTRGVSLTAEGADEEPQLRFEGGSDPPRAGTVLVISGLDKVEAAAVAMPDGRVLALEQQPAPACFLVSDYGMHELRLLERGGRRRTCRFMSTSQLGDYAEALDHFHDSCDWVWDGNWTDELEAATMGMLASLDDYFTQLDAMMERSPMGATMKSEIGPSRKRLEGALAKALEHQDAQSVGRIYGGVRSFLQAQGIMDMLGPMLGGGIGMGPLHQSALYQSVLEFERERFRAASAGKQAEVKEALARLIDTADAHAAELQSSASSDFCQRWWGGLRDTMVSMRDDPEAVIHPLPFQQLRGGGGGHLAEMMKGVMDSMGGGRGSKTVQRSDTIEAVSMINPEVSFEEVDAKVSRWNESLVDEAIPFGGPMNPFEVHGNEPWVQTVMAAIQSILSLGLAYVTQGANDAPTSKLISLLDRDRATLPLNAHAEFLQDRRRRDRLKDVCRIVRAVKKKGQRLSLSVNTDFAGSLKALQEHHTDNWVGPSLEAVWKKMAEQKRAFAFELWLHEPAPADGSEAPAPRLVAADFGHPHTHGLAYYATTRFFDREFRTMQPGFILAFAEAECMRRAGLELWDLGGADKSPMMSYKPQVAIEMGRSAFLRRLRECRLRGDRAEASADAGASPEQRRRLALRDERAAPPSGGERIPTGVVFQQIGEGELWGAAVLQAEEERLRAEQEAAKKAAKKIQKPSKASRKAAKLPDKPPAVPAETGQAPAQPTPQASQPAEAEATPAASSQPAEAGSAPTPPPFQPAERPAPAAAEAPAPTADEHPAAAAAEPTAAHAEASEAAPPAASEAKVAAQEAFRTVFLELVAKGVPHNEAAAQALQIVSCR